MNINKENYSKIIDTCIQISSNFVKEEETKKKKGKEKKLREPDFVNHEKSRNKRKQSAQFLEGAAQFSRDVRDVLKL